jgi:hypothetical protein
MPRMDTRTVAAVGTLLGTLALAGCGGGAKAPTNCPDGTVLKGTDCVPDDSSGDDSSSGSSGSSGKSGGDNGSGGGAAGGGGDSTAGGSTPYDRDAVEVQLKRAARQVKSACGGATDDSGQATGPFGQTKATVTLGRNGRVKQVTVPSPYDGKPAGICAVHAFQKLIFPPYAASADATIDWDIEIVQPAGK